MSPCARRKPRLTASYMPESFSMKALTRVSFGSQFFVSSSEQESWTMCSTSTSDWSATEGMQSLSQSELRKLGVIMLNFMSLEPALAHPERSPAVPYERHWTAPRDNFQS